MTDNINVIEATPSYVTISFSWSPTTTVPGFSFTGSFSDTLLTFTATTVIENQGNDLQGPLTIVEYYWDFGDGTVGYGNPVTHTYNQAFFNAATSLRVTDSKGRQWFTRNQMYVNSAGTSVIVGVARDNVSIIDAAVAVILRAVAYDTTLIVSDIAIKHLLKGFATDLSLTNDAAVGRDNRLNASAFDASQANDRALAHAPHQGAQAQDTVALLDAAVRMYIDIRSGTDTDLSSDNAIGNYIASRGASDVTSESDSAHQNIGKFGLVVETTITFDNATGTVIP